MPRLDIDGLGTLAFPLLDVQALELAALADPAPYGRGEDTLIDPSVRRTRQVLADRVHLGGATWEDTLATVLSQVTTGLGCADLQIHAELYKLLLYEAGGFFAPHRDTEKVEGMFATLVIALPSFHEGGDLIVRHKDREERVSLTPQDSELDADGPLAPGRFRSRGNVESVKAVGRCRRDQDVHRNRRGGIL